MSEDIVGTIVGVPGLVVALVVVLRYNLKKKELEMRGGNGTWNRWSTSLETARRWRRLDARSPAPRTFGIRNQMHGVILTLAHDLELTVENLWPRTAASRGVHAARARETQWQLVLWARPVSRAVSVTIV